MFQCVKMNSKLQKQTQIFSIENERSLCRDNEYRHSLIFELIMTTSFWKKDSVLKQLAFKCYDMSEKGALYRFHFWGQRISFRLPVDKVKARLILMRIGKKPVEVRTSNGPRDETSIARSARENEILFAQGWFDSHITHSVHVPQLDTIMDAVSGVVAQCGLPDTIMDILIGTIVNLTLLCKIDLKDWIAVSAWAMNSLMSLGVKTSTVLIFLGKFQNSSDQQIRAQGLSDFSWLRFLMSFFSLGIFKQELPKEAMMAITKIGGSARGIMNIWQLIEKVVKDGIPLIYKYVTGVPYEVVQLETYFDDIRAWYDEVNELVSSTVLDEISVSQEKCKYVENLYRQGMTYISRAEEMRMDPKMIRAVEFHFNVLRVYYDRVQASGAFKCSPRVEPIVLCITGNPGVGKSGMMFPLAIEMLRALGLQGEELKKWSQHIYTRNVNQEYWDGYHDQLICMYDDFSQKRDTVAAPNEEFFEVIKTANSAPYNLHMAATQDKARTYFKSKAIILSSNTSYFNPQSLTHPDAVRRRIDFMVQVTVKPEFRLHGTDRIDGTKVAAKYPGGFSTDIYNIYICDAMTGHHMYRDPISYDEFLGRLLAKLDAKINGSEKHLRYLNDLAAQIDESDTEEEVYSEPVGTQEAIGLDAELENWTDLAWNSLFNLYQDGFPGFPALRPEFETIDNFKTWLYHNRRKINWVQLYAMKSNPIYEAMDHPVTKLFEVQRSVSDHLLFFLRKSRELIDEFNSFAKTWLARAVEKIREYPVISALLLAVPLVGALWWSSKESEEEKRNRECVLEIGDGETLNPLRKVAIARTLDIRPDQVDTVLGLNVESAQSGDFRTTKNRMKTEMGQSGDSKTTLKNRMKTEMTTSGDLRTKAKTLKTEEGEVKAQILHAELQEDQNAFNLAKRVYSNVYFIEVYNEETRIGKMRGVFVRGRIFLTAKHLLPTLNRGTHVRLYNSKKPTGFRIPKERLNVVPVKGRDGDMKDQVLIDMSILVHDHADILGSLATTEEMSKFRKVKSVMVTPEDDTVLFRYGDVMARDALRTYDSKDETMSIRQHYEYSLETRDGDCGSPIIAISTLLRRKLIGIHVAGGKNIGIATPINADDIVEALQFFEMDAQVELAAQEWVKDLAFPEELHLPKGDFTGIGIGEYFEGGSPNTDITPSKIYGYKEPISKPCFLRPIKVNGSVVDPMMNGLEKCAIPSVALNQDYLKAAVKSVRSNFTKDPERQRVLTNYEALAGIEGDMFAAPIKISTSSGYPWKRKSNKPGKSAWCGENGDYKMSPELAQALFDREEDARNNKRYPTIWVDTLKDERRPIEKVDRGKTRVFAAGPVDYIVASRKYLLGFTAHVAENRNLNEISVGTNAYSTDWDVLAGLMKSKGKNVIAGDFSNFDGTLNVEILHAIGDIINDWYDDGEENQQIRKILWRETINSVHICGRSVYMWTHSQPSGCALTAILNSLYNAIVCRYVWMLVMEEQPEMQTMAAFRKHVSMVSYGDDNMLNISDEAIEHFNQLTMADAFTKIGMTYTDESKSGNMVKARTLDQVSYLKRSFKFDPDLHSWLAPLDLETILEIPNWIRRCPDEDEAVISNIEDAAAELSLHGKEIFEKWTSVLEKASFEADLCPRMLTYFEYINGERFVKGMLKAFS